MIELIPFYQNLLHEVHSKRLTTDNPQFNQRYSISVLNSVLPAILEYVVQNNQKSIVIVTPSINESQIIVTYLIKQLVEGAGRVNGFYDINTVRFFDLKPYKVNAERGIHVGSLPNVITNVVGCDSLLTYYPFTFEVLRQLSGLSDSLVLFDPANKKGNWYAQYIKLALRRENGIVK